MWDIKHFPINEWYPILKNKTSFEVTVLNEFFIMVKLLYLMVKIYFHILLRYLKDPKTDRLKKIWNFCGTKQFSENHL